MADEEQTVRGVSWKEVFGFSHIFKSFKMAIHPGKILLAYVGVRRVRDGSHLVGRLGLQPGHGYRGVDVVDVSQPDAVL